MRSYQECPEQFQELAFSVEGAEAEEGIFPQPMNISNGTEFYNGHCGGESIEEEVLLTVDTNANLIANLTPLENSTDEDAQQSPEEDTHEANSANDYSPVNTRKTKNTDTDSEQKPSNSPAAGRKKLRFAFDGTQAAFVNEEMLSFDALSMGDSPTPK